MDRFQSGEIEAFLRAVDRHLSESVEIRIIGGAAGVLSFRLQSATTDIDLKSVSASDIDALSGSVHFDSACDAARRETGLDIPVSRVGIWDAPWDFESRFRPAPLDGLRKLRVLVPEKYDWALMKIARLDARDIRHIQEAHGAAPFDGRIFLDRFMKEMTHVQPTVRVARQFLAMMEELFGADVAKKMEAELKRLPDWNSI